MKCLFNLLNLMLLCFLLNACDGMSNNNDDKIEFQLEIKPVRVDIKGVKSLLVTNNRNRMLTKADDVEETNAPYALYGVDRNGKVNLTVFYYEVNVVESDSTGVDSYAQVIEQRLSEAIQIVPSIITDLDKYILFSGCCYYINELVISEELYPVCASFVESERAKGNGRTFMIRKDDGALFDVSTFGFLRYASDDDREARYEEYISGSYVAEDSFAITRSGLLVIGPRGVYKLENNAVNSDAVDFRPIGSSSFNCIASDQYGENILLYDSPISSNMDPMPEFDDLNDLYLWEQQEHCFSYADLYDNSGNLKVVKFYPPIGRVLDVVPITDSQDGASLCVLVHHDNQLRLYSNADGGNDFRVYQSEYVDGELTLIDSEWSTRDFLVRNSLSYRVIHYDQYGGWPCKPILQVVKDIAIPENQYDYFYSSGEYLYAVKLNDYTLHVAVYDEMLAIQSEQIIPVELPSDVIITNHYFSGSDLIYQGRYSSGGGQWSMRIDFITNKSNSTQYEGLNVVTFFKIN